MFELFPDGPVYEYPQLVNITYAFLWAFVLASLIAITHKATYHGSNYPRNFFQSLILGALVTTMVMMAIGDSLARGLGVFGAMAIIRFRTRIEDPRDVLFLFAALSTGLAIGVYGFTISFVGAALFCAAAFILHASPFRSFTHHHKLTVTLSDAAALSAIITIVDQHCDDRKQLSVLSREGEMRYEFGLSFRKSSSADQLVNALRTHAAVKQVRVEYIDLMNPQT